MLVLSHTLGTALPWGPIIWPKATVAIPTWAMTSSSSHFTTFSGGPGLSDQESWDPALHLQTLPYTMNSSWTSKPHILQGSPAFPPWWNPADTPDRQQNAKLNPIGQEGYLKKFKLQSLKTKLDISRLGHRPYQDYVFYTQNNLHVYVMAPIGVLVFNTGLNPSWWNWRALC